MPNSLRPLALPDETRVEGCEADDGNGDHGRFEDHECHLVVGEMSIEALGEFGASEDGSYEDD
jgi:hypothetical protein